MNLTEQIVTVVLFGCLLLSIRSKLSDIYRLLKKVHLKAWEAEP